MSRRICQVIVGASEGDAITNMALALDLELQSAGFRTDIFSYWIHSKSLETRITPIDQLPPEGEVDLLVYHLSIGHEVVSPLIKERRDTLAIVYHNITPSDRFRMLAPKLALDLDRGRSDLADLSSRCVIAIADSEFNADDLRAAAYTNVHTVPAGVEPSRLRGAPIDAPLLRTIGADFPNGFVLVVGQVLPHKRMEQCIEAVHLLNSTHYLGLGLVICGPHRMFEYYQSLLEFSRTLPFVGVRFAGLVSDQHLATYYRSAQCFLGMSDHEGFCIPPIEAMEFGLPVVVKPSGAVPETVAHGGIVLPEGAGPAEAAEAIALLLEDRQLRLATIAAGYARRDELSRSDHTRRAALLLAEVAT